MLSKEALFLCPQKKSRTLFITNNTMDNVYVQGLPRKNSLDIHGDPHYQIPETFLEGNSQLQIQVLNTLRFSSYSISGTGVSIAYFDKWDSVIRFNLSQGGINATINLDVSVGSG